MTNMSNFCGNGDITKIYVVESPTPGSDNYVTGGTYSNGTLTLERQNGLVFITGFTNDDTFVTGFTYDNYNLTIAQNQGQPDLTVVLPSFITGYTDTYVTGGTYSSGTATFTNNNGDTFNVTGFTTPFTGNTSGDCITDLFVSNLNSCSPLHVQNVSNGDVLIGENGGVNVGIGTSTPTSKLDINLGGVSGGTIALQTRGSIPYLTSNRTTFSINNNGRLTAGFVGDVTVLPPTLGHTLAAPVGATNAFSVSSDSLTQGLFFINTDGSFSLGNSVIGAGMFESNGVDTFYFGSVLNKQKIGINTNTPSASLHIVGSDSSSNYGLKVQDSGGTDNFVVRNDGNVGIGTSTPTSKLEVNGKTKINGELVVTGNTILQDLSANTLSIINVDTGTTANNVLVYNDTTKRVEKVDNVSFGNLDGGTAFSILLDLNIDGGGA